LQVDAVNKTDSAASLYDTKLQEKLKVSKVKEQGEKKQEHAKEKSKKQALRYASERIPMVENIHEVDMTSFSDPDDAVDKFGAFADDTSLEDLPLVGQQALQRDRSGHEGIVAIHQ